MVFISGAKRGVTGTIAKLLRRRSAIEPMIGHMKNDGRLRRSTLKGTQGDALFTVLCGCGHNIRMILRHLRAVLHRLIRLIRQICMIIHAEMPLCQREQVDKMAAGQRCSGRTSKLSTNLVVCWSGMPNSTFRVRQVWIAASLNCCCRPRLPVGGGVQTISGSNQIDSDPCCFSAVLYEGQFLVLQVAGVDLLM